MLTLAACDGGSGPAAGGLDAADSGAADAIRLTAPNVRADLAIDVTQTTSGGGVYYNALTGQTSTTLTATEPTERFRLHSGTTANGAFAFDLVATDAPTGLADETRTFRIRNGAVTLLDGNNALKSGGAAGLHTVLGTQDGDPLTVMDGLVADALPTVGGSVSRDGGTATVTDVRALPGSNQTVVEIAIQSGGPEAVSATQRRLYTRRNGKFVMDNMTMTTIENEGSTSVRREMRMQFTNVTWPQRIDVMSMSAGTMAASANPWGQHASSTNPCGTPEVPNCPPPIQNPTDPEEQPPGNGGCGGSTLEGGANLVYVHGIEADGMGWGYPTSNNKVRGKNRCDLLVGWDDAPSMTDGGVKGRAHHTTQAAELAGDLRAAARNDLIFVGHSQGGLISRRVAHQFRSLPPPPGQTNPTVRGVVTAGTPHYGANIARNAHVTGTFARVINRVAQGSYACRVSPDCGQVRAGVIALTNSLPLDLMTSDAMRDLIPNSPAIREVNAQAEVFPRFGIQHAIRTKYKLYEVMGDAREGNRGAATRDAAVSIMNYAALTAVVSGVVSILWLPSAAVAAVATLTFLALESANTAWRVATDGLRPSDGVVELSSQRYPNPDDDPFRNRESLTPSSHTAQIDGERSAADIQTTLRSRLGVEPRQ